MLETPVQQRVRLEAAKLGMTMFRNNNGACTDAETGRLIRYGLANDSEQINRRIKSSDLIGWTPVKIGSVHVGKTLAVFTSLEVKESEWKALHAFNAREIAQKAWIDLVLASGGFAGFINDPAQLSGIVRI